MEILRKWSNFTISSNCFIHFHFNIASIYYQSLGVNSLFGFVFNGIAIFWNRNLLNCYDHVGRPTPRPWPQPTATWQKISNSGNFLQFFRKWIRYGALSIHTIDEETIIKFKNETNCQLKLKRLKTIWQFPKTTLCWSHKLSRIEYPVYRNDN